MGKNLKENFLVILITGLFTLFGFLLMIDVFTSDTIRAQIVDASPIRSHTYETTERISKDSPDYQPGIQTTKTVHATEYYRTITVVADGEQTDIELKSDFKFLLPGQGRHITLRRDFDGSYLWDHPLRYFLLGAVLALGGSAIIVSTLRAPVEKKKTTAKKNRKKKK